MDYNKLKDNVKEIAGLASSVPERFQERCFELLLQSLLAAQVGPEAGPQTQAQGPGPGGTKIPVSGTVRAFMQRADVSEEQLNQIMLYDDGQVHFVKEPKPKKKAQGQMEWALLLALKNGILAGEISADPEDVRSICQDKAYYDEANFASNFKQRKNAVLFKKPLEPQGDPQALSGEGEKALGELVRRLTGTGQ